MAVGVGVVHGADAGVDVDVAVAWDVDEGKTADVVGVESSPINLEIS